MEAESESAPRRLTVMRKWLSPGYLVPWAIIIAVGVMVVLANSREEARARRAFPSTPALGAPGAPAVSREGLERGCRHGGAPAAAGRYPQRCCLPRVAAPVRVTGTRGHVPAEACQEALRERRPQWRDQMPAVCTCRSTFGSDRRGERSRAARPTINHMG